MQQPQQPVQPEHRHGGQAQTTSAQTRVGQYATWSMVLGLSSLLGCFFTGVPALVLGVLVLVNPAAEKGAKDRALIGIGTAIGFTILMIIVTQTMQSCELERHRDREEAVRQAQLHEERRQQASAEKAREEQEALAARERAEREAERARFDAMPASEHLRSARSAVKAGNLPEAERHVAAIPEGSVPGERLEQTRREIVQGHLFLAREALDRGYDRSTKTGGDLAAARRHLQAISREAAEAHEAGRLLREVEERRERARRLDARAHLKTARADLARGDWAAAQRQLQGIPDDVPEAREARGLQQRAGRLQRQEQARAGRERRHQARARREEYARNLDSSLIDRGVEVRSVRATGRDGTVLLIDYALCGRVFLNRLFGSAQAQNMARGFGFTTVECRSGFDRAHLDL